MSETKASLASALLDAQIRIVGGVPKSSRNDFAKYNYASSEDIVEAARLALSAAGVLVYRESLTLVEGGPTKDAGGRGWKVSAVIRVVYPPTAESLSLTVELPLVGDKKPDDKIVLGQATTLLGYALRDLLLIARHDEEVDSRDHGRRETPAHDAPRSEKMAALREATGAVVRNSSPNGNGEGQIRAALEPVQSDPKKLRAVLELLLGEERLAGVDDARLARGAAGVLAEAGVSREKIAAAIAQTSAQRPGVGLGWEDVGDDDGEPRAAGRGRR